MDQRLRARERVKLQRDLDRLFKEGRALRYAEFTVRALPAPAGCSRLGLSVGRRVGNAVRRNRVKRLLREAYRLNKPLLTVPCDLAIVPNPGWRDLRLAAYEPAMQRALRDVSRLMARGESLPCPPA